MWQQIFKKNIPLFYHEKNRMKGKEEKQKRINRKSNSTANTQTR